MSKWLTPSAARVEKYSSSLVCTRVVSVSSLMHSFDCSLMRALELNQLTGIAAILTYPLDIDIVEEEERAAREEAEKEVLEQVG